MINENLLKNPWKDYDDMYSVHILGVVFNKKKNSICKQKSDKHGYVHVSIHGKAVGVHRIVAITFLQNEYNKPTVNHKDVNKANNWIDNLEWATHKEQSQHAVLHRCNRLTRYCCIVENDEIKIIYPSIREAWRNNQHVHLTNIIGSCNGDTNSTMGIQFRYYDENKKDYEKSRFDEEIAKSRGIYRKGIYSSVTGKTYLTQMECAKDMGICQSVVSVYLSQERHDKYGLYYIR